MPQAALGAIMVGGSWAAAGGTFGALMASTSLLGIAANFGASLLLSGISQALMGKQSLGGDLGSIQVTRPEPTKAREIVYGLIRKGGTDVYLATSGEDGFEDRLKAGKGRGIRMLQMVIVIAAHPVEENSTIYFNGEAALKEDGGPLASMSSRHG